MALVLVSSFFLALRAHIFYIFKQRPPDETDSDVSSAIAPDEHGDIGEIAESR